MTEPCAGIDPTLPVVCSNCTLPSKTLSIARPPRDRRLHSRLRIETRKTRFYESDAEVVRVDGENARVVL